MKQIIQDYNMFFWNFVNKYDTTNSNILRKIIHSFDVATTSYKIACNLGFDEYNRNLSYLVGLLHDVGRFEQWKLYQTYNDKKSVDHGDLSFDILKSINCEKIFYLKKEDVDVLMLSIKYHTKPYEGKDKRVKLYEEIIKNADAFSNVITTANGAQQMTVTCDGVTKELLNDFLNQSGLWIYLPNTKLDRALMLTACTYYVRYPFLRQEILNARYIDVIYETFSKYLNQEDKITYKNAIEHLKENYIKNAKADINLK